MDTDQKRSIDCLYPCSSVFIRGFFLLLLAAGCRAPNTDLIEAELRTKERQLDDLKAQLNKCECEVNALDSELEQTHKRQFKTTGRPAPVQMVLKQITLGRLTGGVDEDPDCPGDEALQVLLEPRDQDDQSVKAPGSLHVEAFEVTPEGVKTPLSTWEVPARELRRKWESPVFGGSAYRVFLPWKTVPGTERLRVVARFTTPDGRTFEADRDVTLRLPEPPRRKRRPKPDAPAAPAPDSLTPHVCPEPEADEELPPPRVVPVAPPPASPSPVPKLDRKPVEQPVKPPPPPAPGASVPAPVTPLIPASFRPAAVPAPAPIRQTPGLSAPVGARPLSRQ